ncbi:MAG: ATP-binding protein, partial [Anaerolineales bacterium]
MVTSASDVYQKLAHYLDDLPAGFPPTQDGVELRLLQTLFTPAEAHLALHLTLISEAADVIAVRAGKSQDEVEGILEQMAHKGLISSSYHDGELTRYAISQFVIGFWEGQVNHLEKDIVQLFEEYGPVWFEQGPWKKLPQVRTIPVNETIPISSEVMPYEQAEAILRSKAVIAVQNCVCRQERELLGQGCGKPMQVCMSFNSAAHNSVAMGKARLIPLSEAQELLRQAQETGLVLQPANSQDPLFMCMCCDCCCGVLRQIKKEPNPGELVANPFIAQYQPDLCIECGACIEICPMDALTQDKFGQIRFAEVRCIGCGLCVGVCPTNAMRIVRKPHKSQPKIPHNTVSTYISLAQKRGLSVLLRNLWH